MMIWKLQEEDNLCHKKCPICISAGTEIDLGQSLHFSISLTFTQVI